MYTTKAKRLYQNSKSSLPFKKWLQLVGLPRNLIRESEAYRPVEVSVLLTKKGAPHSFHVRPERQGWYNDLQKAISMVVGRRFRDVKVVDYMGNPISNMNRQQLSTIPECDALVQGRAFRMTRATNPVPSFANKTKHRLVETSVKNLLKGVITDIADNLASCGDIQSLNASLQVQGQVQQLVKKAFRDNLIGQNFIKSHSNHDSASNQTAEEIINDVSAHVLEKIKKSTSSPKYGEKIHAHMINKNGELYSSVLGVQAEGDTADYWNLQRQLVQDSMNFDGSTVDTIRKMILDNSHRRFRNPQAVSSSYDPINDVVKTPAVKDTSSQNLEEYDPYPFGHPYWDCSSWWQSPSQEGFKYYVDAKQRVSQSSEVKPPYRGNYERAVQYFQIFAGLTPYPTVEQTVSAPMHDSLQQIAEEITTTPVMRHERPPLVKIAALPSKKSRPPLVRIKASSSKKAHSPQVNAKRRLRVVNEHEPSMKVEREFVKNADTLTSSGSQYSELYNFLNKKAPVKAPAPIKAEVKPVSTKRHRTMKDLLNY